MMQVNCKHPCVSGPAQFEPVLYQVTCSLIFFVHKPLDLFLGLFWFLHLHSVGCFLCLPICGSLSPKIAAISFSLVYICHSLTERWSLFLCPLESRLACY